MAYAVLHEDKADNLHFHLVISANEYKGEQRKWFYKADFASIQTHLERHVLTHYPELEQQAVFYGNLSQEQKETKQNKARLSNAGAELKRRTGNTPKREEVKTTLEAIFSTSTTPQDFTESMKQAGFTFYQRGKHAGIADRDGNKYRFATLGLADDWEQFDQRMRKHMTKTDHPSHTPQDSVPVQSQASQDTHTQQNTHHQQNPKNETSDTTQGFQKPRVWEMVEEATDSMKVLVDDATNFNALEDERKRRLKQIQEHRTQQAKNQTHQQGQGHKPKP